MVGSHRRRSPLPQWRSPARRLGKFQNTERTISQGPIPQNAIRNPTPIPGSVILAHDSVQFFLWNPYNFRYLYNHDTSKYNSDSDSDSAIRIVMNMNRYLASPIPGIVASLIPNHLG